MAATLFPVDYYGNDSYRKATSAVAPHMSSAAGDLRQTVVCHAKQVFQLLLQALAAFVYPIAALLCGVARSTSSSARVSRAVVTSCWLQLQFFMTVAIVIAATKKPNLLLHAILACVPDSRDMRRTHMVDMGGPTNRLASFHTKPLAECCRACEH